MKKKKNPPSTTPLSGEKKPPLKLLVFLSAVFLVAAYYNQWVTMEKLSEAVGPLARFGTIGDFLRFLSQYGGRIFDSKDAFFFHLLWIIPGLGILMEARSRALTRTIALLPKTTPAILLYLGLISLVCLRAYFARGEDMYNGDSSYFFFLTKLMSQNFSRLIPFPFYTFMHGGGAATNQFYGPLFSYIAGGLTLLTGSIHIAVKTTLFLLHLSSVFGIFLFLRILTGSRRSAFIGSLSALLIYFRFHISLFPGRYGEASLWAIYPFLFYFLERLIRRIRLTDILLLGAAVAFLVFASIGLSYYFLIFFALYALTRLLLLPEKPSNRLKIMVAVASSGLLGLLLSSYYLYSFFIESKWNITAEMFGQGKIGGIEAGIFLPTFLWNSYQISLFRIDIPWKSAYFGLSLILLSFIGFVMALKKGQRHFIALVIPAILSVVFLVGYGRIPLLLKIPYLHTYSQSRLLNLAAFAVVVLSAAGFHFLDRKNLSRGKNILFPVMAVIFFDLFPTTFHDTAGRTYGDDAAPFFEMLRKESSKSKDLPEYRTEIVGPPLSRAVHENWRAYNAFVSETGMPLTAESGNDYIRTLKTTGWFRSRLTIEHAGIQERPLSRFYFLHNTRYILSTIPLPPDWFRSVRKNRNVFLYEMNHVSPVYFTSRLTPTVFSSNNLFRYLGTESPDPSSAIAEAAWILTRNAPEPLSGKPQAKLLSHRLRVRRADMRIIAETPVYAVLSYAAYPTIRVMVNGVPVRFFETIQGTIAIRLDPGTHWISIRPSRSRNAAIFFWLPTILFAAIGAFLAKQVIKRPKKEGPV